MSFNEKAWHVGFKWTIGDENNPTGAIALDDASDALHICEIRDVRTDWNVSSLSHPTLYVHSATTPETDYIASRFQVWLHYERKVLDVIKNSHSSQSLHLLFHRCVKHRLNHPGI